MQSFLSVLFKLITNIQARHGAGLGLAIAKAFVTLLW
jgi:hypothetical protein